MSPTSSLGEFEQIVLLAVLRLGDEAYGVTILAEIAAKTGRNPAPGALYTTLHRMESKGLVTSRDGSPTPERGGRAKRFVSVTREGRNALANAQSAYRSLMEGLDLLAEPARFSVVARAGCSVRVRGLFVRVRKVTSGAKAPSLSRGFHGMAEAMPLSPARLCAGREASRTKLMSATLTGVEYA
jgi:PadR family transcriptional regulator PadR